jgi:hypothetical protein
MLATALALVSQAGCAAALLSTVACVADTGGAELPSLREILRDETPLVLATSESRVAIDEAELELTGGGLTVTTPLADVLTIERLELRFRDVVIDLPETPLDGMVLTDVHVTLPEAIDVVATWSGDGDAAFADAETELLLHWSLVTRRGAVVPLAPQHLRGIDLNVNVYRQSDGGVVAELVGGSEGVIFNWADVATISDLRVDVRANR